MTKEREAWDKLYSKRGLQYGGSGHLGLLDRVLKPEMIVLDAGCGDGKTTEILAKKCDVVGCDFSKEALASLRSQRDPGHALDLVECNLTNLPFEPEKFNAITCVHALSHLSEEDRVHASDELVRVLKQEGHLMVEVFGKGDLRFGEGTEIEHSTFARGSGIMTHYFEEGEISGLLKGLEILLEIDSVRRVSYGARAGKRHIIRVFARKG